MNKNETKMLGQDKWRRDPIKTTFFVGQVRKKYNQSESFEGRLIYRTAEPFSKAAARAGTTVKPSSSHTLTGG